MSRWSIGLSPFGLMAFHVSPAGRRGGAAAPLGPLWVETHGSGGAVDSLRDSVVTNAHGWVTSWQAIANGTSLASETYSYAANTDLTAAAGDTYTYDPITQRLTARATAGGTRHYTYDRAGNLVKDSLAGGAVIWTYGYDALNRLRSAWLNGDSIARYAYDVAGRRIAKRVYSSASGGTVGYTRFVYQGSHVAYETTEAGAITLRYTWGLSVDDLIAVRDAAGNHYYIVQDQLRSVRGLVKRSDGAWQVSWRYGPWGRGVDSAGSSPIALRYRWTGREYDAELGWYFFRSRYYDLGARRFVQEDAIGYAGGPSLYGYGEGNPLNGRDPDGLRKNFEAYERKILFRPIHGPEYSIDGAWVGGGAAAVRMVTTIAEINARLDWQAYRRYLRSYTNALAAIVDEFRREYADDPDPAEIVADYLESNTSPLSFGQFVAIQRAISYIGGCACGSQEAQAMSTLLSAGAVGIEEGGAWGSTYTAGSRTFVTFGAGLFHQSGDFIANIVAHEAIHALYPWAGDEPGREGAGVAHSLSCGVVAAPWNPSSPTEPWCQR